MPTGTLKAWIAERGFGFIKPRIGGPDLFFHLRDLGVDPAELVVGDELEYEVATGRDGRPMATRVRWAQE